MGNECLKKRVCRTLTDGQPGSQSQKTELQEEVIIEPVEGNAMLLNRGSQVRHWI